MTSRTDLYTGQVVFVAGVHYPVGDDGHAILKRGLRVNEDGSYRYANAGEPLHNDAHHLRDTELEPGGEG